MSTSFSKELSVFVLSGSYPRLRYIGEWTPTKPMPLTHETHKPPGLMVIPGTNRYQCLSAPANRAPYIQLESNQPHGFFWPMMLASNTMDVFFWGIELYFLAPGQVLDQIEIGGNIRFSRNKQLICCHARIISLSRVKKPRPLFRSKANSLPLTPSGITSYCQNWWTRSVTLRSLLVANEMFYYWTSGP